MNHIYYNIDITLRDGRKEHTGMRYETRADAKTVVKASISHHAHHPNIKAFHIVKYEVKSRVVSTIFVE